MRGTCPRFVVLALLLGACVGGPIKVATPVPSEGAGAAPTSEGCLDALLEGELLRDDGSGFIVRHAEGFVIPVVWPDGYSVSDGVTRELLDPDGRVAAREGEWVALVGGEYGSPPVFHVCGSIRVTPAR